MWEEFQKCSGAAGKLVSDGDRSLWVAEAGLKVQSQSALHGETLPPVNKQGRKKASLGVPYISRPVLTLLLGQPCGRS